MEENRVQTDLNCLDAPQSAGETKERKPSFLHAYPLDTWAMAIALVSLFLNFIFGIGAFLGAVGLTLGVICLCRRPRLQKALPATVLSGVAIVIGTAFFVLAMTVV